MTRVGSSTDWITSNRRFPASRIEASWLARVASRNASRCSGFTWQWTSVTNIGLFLSEPGVVGRAALEEPPVAPAALELAVLHDHRPATQHDVRPALDLPALVAAVVHVHVVAAGADRALAVRVVDHEVRVRADRNRALLRVHAEQPRGLGRDDLDPALLADLPAHDAAVVQQVDAVLDARQPVGDLPEVAAPQLLLAMEVERAVIGRDHLEVVLPEARPQLLPVRVLLAQRRRAHELRSVEAVAQVVQAQEQVLR